MRIEAATIRNWMPFYGEFSLTFPAGPIAIVARYDGNPRRSNWAGKTAFLEAIEWCFFGVHRKRTDDAVIHNGEGSTLVALKLSGGIEITRSRALGKSTKVTVDDNGNSYRGKQAEARILEILGFDKLDYRATNNFQQGDIEAIVSRKSGKRRETISEWLELEHWARVRARASVVSKKATYDLEMLRITDKGDESFEDYDPDTTATLIGSTLGSLYVKSASLESLEVNLEQVAESEILRQDRESLFTLEKELRELGNQLKATPKSVNDGVIEELRAQRDSLMVKERSAQEALSEARELVKGNFDGTCPVTCNDCPVADTVRDSRLAFVSKLKLAREAASTTSKNATEKRRELNQLESENREFSKLVERYNAKSSQRRRLLKSIEERSEGTSELTDEEVERMKGEKSRLKREVLETRDELVRLMRLEREYEESVQEALKRETELRELELTSQVHSVILKATSSNGIPAMIAKSSLLELETVANEILAESGLSFEFSWERESASELSPSCDSCGYVYRGQRDKSCPACEEPRTAKLIEELEILVNDGSGIIEDASTKSGGAKVLVASAIRLGAGLMLRTRRGSQLAWATVDEPFGALDVENREMLARTFVGMLSSVGLEQAFVVSHDATVLDALPYRIEVVRNGDASRIEVV